MSLAGLLFQAARHFPDRPAVSIGRRQVYDYAAYAALSARMAAGFETGFALPPGARVALAMNNSPQYLALLFAIWRAGLVAVPVSARLHPREIGFILADSGAALCLADADLAAALGPHLPPACRLVVPGEAEWRKLAAADPGSERARAPQDPAWIFYTSGTTGHPKGAILSGRNLLAMTISYLADVDCLTPEDCFLHLAAQSHACGLFGLSHIAKATHQVLPESGGLDPAELVDLLRHYSSASLFLPPTGLRRLLREPGSASLPPGHLRSLLLGAAPLDPADLRQGVERFGPHLWNGYGQGESPCTITALSKDLLAAAVAEGDDARLASVGIARTGMDLAILDPDDRPCGPGEIGEVAVRGETVMSSYLNRPEETAEALRGGWLHTGDLGRLDERGFLTLLDRAKDLIISGGANIYPREVEAVLLEDPSLAEAAVIGVPDPEWGESVMACLVPRAGTTPDLARLELLCLERIARYKRPRQWRILESLPRNPAGKVLKRDLRQRFAPAPPMGEAAPGGDRSH